MTERQYLAVVVDWQSVDTLGSTANGDMTGWANRRGVRNVRVEGKNVVEKDKQLCRRPAYKHAVGKQQVKWEDRAPRRSWGAAAGTLRKCGVECRVKGEERENAGTCSCGRDVVV